MIVINIELYSFLVDIRCNSRPLLKAMLRYPKCYNMSLAYSSDRASNRNFNRKLVNERSIGKVVRIVS